MKGELGKESMGGGILNNFVKVLKGYETLFCRLTAPIFINFLSLFPAFSHFSVSLFFCSSFPLVFFSYHFFLILVSRRVL